MDTDHQAYEHLVRLLEPMNLRFGSELCQQLWLEFGDQVLEQHPASIMARANTTAMVPVEGHDTTGDLRWSVSSPNGLPQVRVDLSMLGIGHDHFDTSAPFHADKIERDYLRTDATPVGAGVYRYLTEDLVDDARSEVWLAMSRDAQTHAHRAIDAMKIRGWEGWGAVLRNAAEAGRVEAVKDALAIGISPGLADPQGNTALHLAAGNGHGPVLTPLIEAGADPNARNDDGRTPLHLAATNKWAVACLTLMANGADPMAKDNRGRIPSARDHVRVFAPSL